MRFAYADPPYPGMARKHYRHHNGGEEVDHPALIKRLTYEYPDGWALSSGSKDIGALLPLMPTNTRIMIWTKSLVFFKPGVNPAYSWEPVYVNGGRKRRRPQPTIYDWVNADATHRRGLAGAKPDAFFYWLFAIFNLHPDDTLDDLYPGTGRLTACRRAWSRQLTLFPPPATSHPKRAVL